MGLLWIVIEFLVTFFQLLYMLLIPTFQLDGLRESIKKWHIASYIICSDIIITVYNFFTENSITSIYVMIAIIIFYVILLNKGNIVSKIFWMIVPFLLYFIFELIVIDIMMAVSSMTIDLVPKQNVYRFVGMVLCVLFEIIGLVIGYHYSFKIYIEQKIYMIPIIVSLLITVSLQLLGKQIWQIAISLFLVNIIYLLYIKIHTQSLTNRYTLQTKQNELKKKHYNELLALRDDMNNFQGKINESLQVFWRLAKLDNLPDIEKYLNQFSHINTSFAQMYNTGNHYLDAILTTKAAYARKYNIDFQTEIKISMKASLDYVSMGNMLIHLIDNAMSATNQIPDDSGIEKMVKLSIRHRGAHYLILLENPTNCATGPTLETLLAEKGKGLGLKSVKDIADKTNASFEINHEDGLFTASILLPQ